MKYKSIACWPKGTVNTSAGEDVSVDEHDTYNAAEGVCNLLHEEGFGGNGKIFPISTRVEPSRLNVPLIQEAIDAHEAGLLSEAVLQVILMMLATVTEPSLSAVRELNQNDEWAMKIAHEI